MGCSKFTASYSETQHQAYLLGKCCYKVDILWQDTGELLDLSATLLFSAASAALDFRSVGHRHTVVPQHGMVSRSPFSPAVCSAHQNPVTGFSFSLELQNSFLSCILCKLFFNFQKLCLMKHIFKIKLLLQFVLLQSETIGTRNLWIWSHKL